MSKASIRLPTPEWMPHHQDKLWKLLRVRAECGMEQLIIQVDEGGYATIGEEAALVQSFRHYAIARIRQQTIANFPKLADSHVFATIRY